MNSDYVTQQIAFSIAPWARVINENGQAGVDFEHGQLQRSNQVADQRQRYTDELSLAEFHRKAQLEAAAAQGNIQAQNQLASDQRQAAANAVAADMLAQRNAASRDADLEARRVLAGDAADRSEKAKAGELLDALRIKATDLYVKLLPHGFAEDPKLDLDENYRRALEFESGLKLKQEDLTAGGLTKLLADNKQVSKQIFDLSKPFELPPADLARAMVLNPEVKAIMAKDRTLQSEVEKNPATALARLRTKASKDDVVALDAAEAGLRAKLTTDGEARQKVQQEVLGRELYSRQAENAMGIREASTKLPAHRVMEAYEKSGVPAPAAAGSGVRLMPGQNADHVGRVFGAAPAPALMPAGSGVRMEPPARAELSPRTPPEFQAPESFQRIAAVEPDNDLNQASLTFDTLNGVLAKIPREPGRPEEMWKREDLRSGARTTMAEMLGITDVAIGADRLGEPPTLGFKNMARDLIARPLGMVNTSKAAEVDRLVRAGTFPKELDPRLNDYVVRKALFDFARRHPELSGTVPELRGLRAPVSVPELGAEFE